MSQLLDNLREMKRQKDEYILPDNIKKDVEIFNVLGEYVGEAVNAIFSVEYDFNDGNVYSVASDGSTRTPYRIVDGELIITTGQEDILRYSINDRYLEVEIDG